MKGANDSRNFETLENIAARPLTLSVRLQNNPAAQRPALEPQADRREACRLKAQVMRERIALGTSCQAKGAPGLRKKAGKAAPLCP